MSLTLSTQFSDRHQRDTQHSSSAFSTDLEEPGSVRRFIFHFQAGGDGGGGMPQVRVHQLPPRPHSRSSPRKASSRRQLLNGKLDVEARETLFSRGSSLPGLCYRAKVRFNT